MDEDASSEKELSRDKQIHSKYRQLILQEDEIEYFQKVHTSEETVTAARTDEIMET